VAPGRAGAPAEASPPGHALDRGAVRGPARSALWRRRGHGAGAPQAATLGVFLAGPDAFGFRTYLTADEARQLAADWAAMLARFGDRAEDPSRRPEGAVPFEVVVLGRQVPDLVGAGRGLPGPDRPGQAT
jgi:hypothetical protein